MKRNVLILLFVICLTLCDDSYCLRAEPGTLILIPGYDLLIVTTGNTSAFAENYIELVEDILLFLEAPKYCKTI